MRRWHRNADPRLRELRRALAADPSDVELQHATMIATVRAGELPSEAIGRLIPGRPVQPWQWIPASYVLLEAERVGRATNWQEGKVEVEWARDRHAPAWVPLLGADDPHARAEWDAGLAAYEMNKSVHLDDLGSRFYVGARAVGWADLQAIANTSRESQDVRDPEYHRYVLGVIPPRWIPGLTDAEGWGLDPHHTFIAYADRLLPEQAGIHRPSEYDGAMPDAHDPQMLLYASKRIVSSGSDRARDTRHLHRKRRLQRTGPLLDVRLIDRARIMDKRGRRWV